MLSHVMERYFTNTLHVDLSDALCEGTMKTIMRHARVLRQDANNYNSWAELALAGNLAQGGLLELGRESDWACHFIEHELSALYDVGHGAGLAVVTLAWMKYIYKSNIPMFVQFAVNVMGVEQSYRLPEEIVLEGISRLEQFVKEMGLPTRLAELDIDDIHIENMAIKATGDNFGMSYKIGNIQKLTTQDVIEILKLAM